MSSRPLTHRQRQAAATRTIVVAAARRVFGRDGYGAATITAIAAEAGVAVNTVYKIYGNKRALLAAVADQWETDFGADEVGDIPSNAPDALTWWAGLARRQWESGLDVAMIYAGAAATQPEVREDFERRLAMRDTLLQGLSSVIAKSVKPGTSPNDAIAVVSAVSLPEVYRELVFDRGWTPDDYQQWVERTLIIGLLRDSAT